MRYTEFKYGKYYSSFSLSQNKLCIAIGEDFRYKLFVYNDGYYHLIENDYIPTDLTEEYFELELL